MEIQHPARDRAEDNKQKTEASLSEALNTIKDLNEYLLKKQKFEDILALGAVEKSIEKSIDIIKSIALKD